MAYTVRWYVAYNTAQSTSLGSQLNGGNINPDTPSGYESLPAGDAADNAQFAAAAAATKLHAFPAGQGPTISVENIKWANVNGPYATQAQANAAIPAIQKAEPAPSAGTEASSNLLTLGGAVTDPLNYLEDVGDFFHRLTEAAFWERAGEVLLGGILLYIGIRALTRDTAVNQAAKKTGGTFKRIAEVAAVAPK